MSPRLPHTKDGQMAVPLATDSQLAVPLATTVGGDPAELDLLRLLADAGAALSAALDEAAVCEGLARLAVPQLADWCVVDLVDGDAELQPIAAAHEDTTFASLLRESAMRARTRLDEPFGRGKVARSAERELIPDVNDATLALITQRPDELTLWRTVGLRARLILPLRWDDAVYGTVLLAQSESGRRFDERSVLVAEELARIAALALARWRAMREAGDARDALERTQRELTLASKRLADTFGQLASQAQIAEEARQEAQEASQAKGQFLARMSHELRTPLNAIGGYTQLLEMGVRGPITDAQREDLLRIQRSQRHLLALVNDVLNLAKLQSGRVAFDIAAVPVARIVGEVTALVQPQLDDKQQELELVGMDSDQEALCDEEKVRQILLNLLSNAVKFTGAGGRLRVFIDGDAASVRLGVQDSGIGLPAEKLESVFEPFVQLSHPLTGVQEGSGLGLAISRDLALGMGGELVVASELGVGSTFTLVLRRAAADQPQGTPADTPMSPAPGP